MQQLQLFPSCSSDHIIGPIESFAEYVRKSDVIAKEGFILTFGITPDKPETGYGYIKKGQKTYFDFRN